MRPLPSRLRQALRSQGEGLAILVVRFGALGDVLRTLPAVRLVRGGLPKARIVWAIGDALVPLLRGHPDLDALLPFPRWLRDLARSPRRWPRLVRIALDWRRRLRDTRAGLVLDFHGDLRSGVTGLVAGAPVRLGYSGHQQKEGNFLFTTHRVRAGDRRTHRVERNLDLVRALELPDGPVPDGGLALAAEAIDAARAVAGASEPYAVIAAGVSRRQRYKRPPPVLLAAAAAALAERGVTPLVVWGPGEREDAEEVATRAVGGARLAPPTDLPVLAALLRRARVYVGGDTGPLHLACAVGCPTLGLYGPTDPVVNGPWRVPGIALSPPGRHYTGVKGRDRRGGFDGLTAELVRGAVEELLRTTGARSQAL